jgi:hypothetical protein
LGNWIQDEPRLAADFQPAGDRRRREEGHVDVFQVEDCKDLSARGDDFAVARQLVLHPPGSGRHQNQIVQNGINTLDLGLRTFDCVIGLFALRDRSLNIRLGSFIIPAALIECLLRDDLSADELLPTLEV